MPLSLSLSERPNGEQLRGCVRCKLCLSRSRSQLLGAFPVTMVRLAHRKGYRLVGANRFGFNLIFAEKCLYEDRVPEVSLAQILRHPDTPSGFRYLKG
jgi:hypothetical protein